MHKSNLGNEVSYTFLWCVADESVFILGRESPAGWDYSLNQSAL